MVGPGGTGKDWSGAFDKNPEAARDVNLSKQMKNPKQAQPAEGIIDGVTHESIDEFVQSRKNRRDDPKPTGIFARLRSLIGR